MKTCQMTIEDKKNPLWDKVKPCGAKARWVDEEGRLLCTRHKNSSDKFYMRIGKEFRCKPLEEEK